LETIRDEGLVANAARRGDELTQGLLRLMAEDKRIGDVRGPRLMVGVELVRDRESKEPDGDLATDVVARCAELGLLVLSCGLTHQVVRWIAPINATAAEIAEGVEIFGEALRTV
jgi:4-aminobutyrate aminotransferase/(S)-3-amino-2-methylpropionate transaminase